MAKAKTGKRYRVDRIPARVDQFYRWFICTDNGHWRARVTSRSLARRICNLLNTQTRERTSAR